MLNVKIDEIVGDLLSLFFIGTEYRWLGQPSAQEVDLPCKIEAIVHAGVRTLSGKCRVTMAGLFKCQLNQNLL